MVQLRFMWLVVVTEVSTRAIGERGVTVTRFSNSATAGAGKATVVDTPDRVPTCIADCSAPHSLRITGRLRPTSPGNYGFNVTFDPPLIYPSREAYARLWVNDHLLFPYDSANTNGKPLHSAARAPLWIPLPPRALDRFGVALDDAGGAPLGSYEFRFEYVAVAPALDANRTVSIRIATFAYHSTRLTPFTAIPVTELIPTQSASEVTRRALYTRLQQGWGTFYHRSMTTWLLLPEAVQFGLGLYRQSKGEYLPAEGLTLNKPQLYSGAKFAIGAGPHSYNQSFAEVTLTWFQPDGNLNVTVAATVDNLDSSQLTLQVTVNRPPPGSPDAHTNASDYLLIVEGNVTAGRAGSVTKATDGKGVTAAGVGLRSRTLRVVRGAVVGLTNATAIPTQSVYIAVSLSNAPVALATEATETPQAVAAKTEAYRLAERATLALYGEEWSEVKDAIQTALMWSFMYDPKEGLVAPMFQFTKGDYDKSFSDASIDGDTTIALFCWDGSFASYMLSLDALELSLSNLIQIIKMRTSAGFLPSYSSGTVKSRDRSNPPVTAKVLYEIVQRWGAEKTLWVVDLCFDDLFNWNTWLFANRREVPLGLMSWGSSPYPYAPDGTRASNVGNGGGGANLVSCFCFASAFLCSLSDAKVDSSNTI